MTPEIHCVNVKAFSGVFSSLSGELIFIKFNEGDKEFYCIPETREMVSQYIFLQEEQFETLVNFDYSSARLTGRISDISSRRGKVQGMDSDGHFQIINAEIPRANLHDYATALKAMSSGRGMFNLEFSHYQDMPHVEQQKVISDYEASRLSSE